MIKNKYYIPLEDMNFFWRLEQVETVINCYKQKMNIVLIARKVKRSQDECAVLIMDLGRKGMI